MKKIFYIAIFFGFAISSDADTGETVEEKYELAKKYRNNKKIDSCLLELFEIKDVYLKANFDIASIYYQEYKNYDIAVHFFNSIIEKYKYSNDKDFIESNLNIYKNSMFFLAYIYVNDLELYTKGVEMYQNFINNFPDDELSDDAIHELNALNKKENEIELLKNNLE